MTTTRAAARHGCGHVRRHAALPGWARGWAYAACVTPLLGLTAADTFWMVGMPIDVLARGVQAAWQAPGPTFAVAVVALPAVGGVLAPAVAGRSGRMPSAAGHAPRLPFPLAVLVSAVTVAVAVYWLIGSAMVARALLTTTATWPQVRADWADTGAAVVALAWVISLGVATVGYRLAARGGCDVCGAAQPERHW